jgi:hypothetical protein
MTIDQQLLNIYFATAWRNRKRDFGDYRFSGFGLIDKIQPNERVIDIGCGFNPFKGHIPDLVGIDPAFPEADYQLSLEDYIVANTTSKFNVAFCLGSINFGEREHIENQIKLITGLLCTDAKSRIYWRCNPGRKDHNNSECEEIPFYDWSFDEHIRLAKLFNFEITELEWDSNNRIYAEWVYQK